MAYVKLTPEEKKAGKEARERAKEEDKFFEDLFEQLDDKLILQGFYADADSMCTYTSEEVAFMVREAYKAGQAAG